MQMYRQGDVLLIKIAKLPDELIKLDHTTLALGEATGHSHAIRKKGTATLLAEPSNLDAEKADLERLFLNVHKKTQLEHEEHGAIALDPGYYRVVQQKTYSPTGVRRVLD